MNKDDNVYGDNDDDNDDDDDYEYDNDDDDDANLMKLGVLGSYAGGPSGEERIGDGEGW